MLAPMADENETEELPGADTAEGQRLQDAQLAFERGNYAKVRELTATLTGGDPDVAAAATALRRRTSVDPAQVGIVVACLVFFLFIVGKYVL